MPGASVRGRIGDRYLVLDEIGSGGMGVVYLGYDPVLHREVALKQVHRTTLGSHGERRLIREARIMARLAHPNVVRVFDVLATADGPVLVMDLVRGSTLRAWAKAQRRRWTEIVDAFVQAGHGLNAGHQLGIVHRDFKPTNVLVDADGTAKVTDFGLARTREAAQTDLGRHSNGHTTQLTPVGAASEFADDDASLTRDNARLGTPAYMAPEQHDGRPASAASDQYAFCVALWEALCGHKPFAGPMTEFVLAKHRGPPSWSGPSDVPRAIRRAIGRGLAVDPAARWPSMEALLGALERALRRRSWRAFAIAGSALVLGTSAAIVPLSGPEREICRGAEQQLRGVWSEARALELHESLVATGHPNARAASERTVARLDAYAAAWIGVHRDACEAVHVRHEQTPALLDLRMACLHDRRTSLAAVVDVLVEPQSGAQPSTVDKAVQLVADLPGLASCSDPAQLVASGPLPPSDADTRDRLLVLRGRLARGAALVGAGRFDAAKVLLDEMQREADALGHPPFLAEVMLQLGTYHEATGDYAAAETAWLAAYRVAMASDHRTIVAPAAARLAYAVGVRQARAGEGKAWSVSASAWARRVDPGGAFEALALNAEGNLAVLSGDYPAAERSFRSSIAVLRQLPGGIHPELPVTLLHLGSTLVNLGRPADAHAALREALDLAERVLGPSHPTIPSILNSLAAASSFLGDLEQARTSFERAVAIASALHGPDHPMVGKFEENLGTLLLDLGRLDEARPRLEHAIAIARSSYGPNHPYLGTALGALGRLQHVTGDLEEAERSLRASLAAFSASVGPQHPAVASDRVWLADVLTSAGRFDEAEVEFEHAFAIFEAALGPTHHALASTLAARADLELARQRPDAALSFLDRALAIQETSLGSDHPELGATLGSRAKARLALGDFEAAAADLRRARSLVLVGLGPDHPQVADLDRLAAELAAARSR